MFLAFTMLKTSARAYWSCQFIGWCLFWGASELNRFYQHMAGHKIEITFALARSEITAFSRLLREAYLE
jgi:hypothetical protein